MWNAVRHERGMVSAIPWTAVRHHGGMLPAINVEWCPRSRGICSQHPIKLKVAGV